MIAPSPNDSPAADRQRVPANGRKTKATRWELEAEWKARLGKPMLIDGIVFVDGVRKAA